MKILPRKYKKRSFRRPYRRKARGRRTTLKRTIKQVLNRNTETKYYDVADENVQIYHNMGRSGGAILGPPQHENDLETLNDTDSDEVLCH